MMLGTAAAWLANKWLQLQIQPAHAVESNTVPVLVARTEIPLGQKLDAESVRVIEWSRDTVPQGTYSSVEDITGKVVKDTIYPGEPILQYRVVDKLDGSTLSAIIEKNKRAVTVRVNDVVGVAGFILPGNRVDVIATRKKNIADNNAKTRTILQNMKVLAVDQSATNNKDLPVIVRAVTLEASRKEAEKLIQAANEGPIQLALRNTLDTEVEKEKVVAKVKKVYSKPKPEPEPEYMTVIRGTTVDRVELQNGEQ
jgi:pilus assembly protein CpaB